MRSLIALCSCVAVLSAARAHDAMTVDDQLPQMVPKIKAAISDLGGGAVDFAINTHWHFDHADGNSALGSEGTWIVSQINSRQVMTEHRIINLVSEMDESSTVIPGHGPIAGYADLGAYTEMLKTVRTRIADLIDQGKSLDEVIAATPTAEFDEKYGNPGLMINRAYASLSR